MYKDTDGNLAMQRVFRRHKGLVLFLPGSLWLMIIVLILAAVLYFSQYSHHALWLFILTVFPLFRMLQLYLAWLSYSVVAFTGVQVLVERSGLIGVSERRVPLSDFSTVESERPWWARLLGIDVGNVIVGAIGSPLALHRMGDFADLWVVLESKGQIVPPKRPSALASLSMLLWHSIPFVTGLILKGLYRAMSRLAPLGRLAMKTLVKNMRRLRQVRRPMVPATAQGFAAALPSSRSAKAKRASPTALRRGVPSAGYVYQSKAFAPSTVSYAGFCAFCRQFIMLDKDWTRNHYRAPDHGRQYYPDGVSDLVAHFYLLNLKQACILIPSPNGHSGERLSCRIHSIEDIQRLVPDLSRPLDQAG